MKNHIRVICLIFAAMLVVPYIVLALTKTPSAQDPTEPAVVESTEDAELSESIEETEYVEPIEETVVEATVPVETSVPKTQKPMLPEAEGILYEDVGAPETPETVPVINLHERELLACVIYQETGGDKHCDDCRRRVADVALNRVADPRFPDTLWGVLTEPGQYGFNPRTGVVWAERASYAEEQHAVERAYRIAEEVLSGKHSSLYGEGYVWQATFVQGRDNVYCCGHYYGR